MALAKAGKRSGSSLSIVDALKYLVETRTPIGIKLLSSEEIFNTQLLGVDEITREIFIDELIPKEGNGKLSPIEPATFTFKLKGTDYAFTCDHCETEQQDGSFTHRLQMPDNIRLSEKRSHFRLTPLQNDRPQMTLSNSRGTKINGIIRDISIKGCGLNTPLNSADIPTDELVYCNFVIEKLLVECDAIIRRSGVTQGNIKQLGLEFWNLNDNLSSKLNRAIMRLQRRVLQTEASTL